jgi:diguanylate cyclase (GGDEF)-like protein
MGEWLAAAREGALILIDLDQLSRVNDAFGHAAGDAVLRRISVRLRKILRDGDFLGRLGGDQFGVLLAQGTRPILAEVVARKLLDAIAKPVMIEGSDVVTTASAGICLLASEATMCQPFCVMPITRHNARCRAESLPLLLGRHECTDGREFASGERFALGSLAQ